MTCERDSNPQTPKYRLGVLTPELSEILVEAVLGVSLSSPKAQTVFLSICMNVFVCGCAMYEQMYIYVRASVCVCVCVCV